MNCLHILPMNKLSGAEKLALILCKNMNTYKPIVVCGGEELKSIFERENIDSYSIEFLKNNILENIKQLKQIIKENDISIIHAHDNNASVSAYFTKVLYRLDIKIVSHIHSCYPWLKENSKFKLIDTILRKKYSHNIACGKLVYNYYEENTNYINLKNTTILSNAIDVYEIEKNQNQFNETMYDKLNIPRDKKIIGFVGRMTDAKALIPFIKEIEKYKTEFYDSIFLLVGSGELENEIKSLIKKLGLDSLFILVGNRKDVYDFYRIMDFLFLSSVYEGLPMVMLEAMSFGKSFVSTNVGSINEIIEDNVNGYLVEKDEYDKLIEKIIKLKNDEIAKRDFGYRSLQKIKSNYDIKKYVERLEKLYDELLTK